MNISNKLILVFLVLWSWATITHASIGGYISKSDKRKFAETLVKGFTIELDDISKSYYTARGLAILKEPFIDIEKLNHCSHIRENYKPTTTSLEATFNSFNTWLLLGCEGKLYTDTTVKKLQSALEDVQSTTADIRYAVEILSHLKLPIPNPTKVAQLIQTQLKEDDSLVSVGHALHAASLLGNAGIFAHDRIEDVIVQADEINGKLLQWEGGLTTTSLLITGLLRLPGASPFTQVQADKLANYLLSRTTVQTPKGVHALLEAAVALAASNVSPVSVTVIGPSQVPVDKPELKVQISDIFGNPLKVVPSPVVVQSATRISDDVVVLSKQPVAAGRSPSEFLLNLRVEPGYYRILLYAGSHIATLTARILGPVKIESLELGLSDADGSSAPKMSQLAYPEVLESKLQGDLSQHLIVKFSLSRPVHQAFIRLYSGKREIIFISDRDSNKLYKVEINLANRFANSDSFEIELILGDSIIANPIRWHLGTIEINVGSAESQSPKIVRGPKPEIKHLFRLAEKRPAEAMSLFFTGLTAAPLLILLILWAKIGINFGNFTPLAFPFHLGLGSILGLFTLFWLKLDMFVTCAWLIPIGGFTFLSGHKLLSHIAGLRKTEKAEK